MLPEIEGSARLMLASTTTWPLVGALAVRLFGIALTASKHTRRQILLPQLPEEHLF